METTDIKNKKANYMVKENGVSLCKYADSTQSQESCTGYVKNSYENRCTFYINDGMCNFTPEAYRNITAYNNRRK